MSFIIITAGGEDIVSASDPTKNEAVYTLRAVGYASSFAAMTAIQLEISPFVGVGGATLYLTKIDLNNIEADIWEATATYLSPEEQQQVELPALDTPELTFDVGGMSVHVTQGYEVMNAWPQGADKQRFHGQINRVVDAKGNRKINGTDVEVPTLGVNVDYTTPQPANPFGLARTLANYAQGINSTAWYGFNPGDLRFRGAQVRGKLLDKWKMRLQMEASPTTVIPVNFGTAESPNITQCTKRGWDYFWIYYANVLVREFDEQGIDSRPVYAFSHRMFNQFDFRVFGLGG
jgi:hypothetical protein